MPDEYNAGQRGRTALATWARAPWQPAGTAGHGKLILPGYHNPYCTPPGPAVPPAPGHVPCPAHTGQPGSANWLVWCPAPARCVKAARVYTGPMAYPQYPAWAAALRP